MSSNQDGSGGSNSNPSGEGETEAKVSRAAYEKSVTAEKNARKERDALQKQIDEINAKTQADTDQKLLDEKNFREVIDKQKKQIDELTGKFNGVLQDRDDTRKLNAALGLFQEKGIQVESKYLGLIPLESIQFNSDGTIDHTTVLETVNNFQKEHPKLLANSTSFPPNDKTGGSGKKMTLEEWKKLPSNKEREDAYKAGRVQNPYQKKK